MNAYKMFSGGKGGASGEGQTGNSADMVNNAMKVYKMFSGDKGAGTSGSGATGGGGNIFESIGMYFDRSVPITDRLFLFY